MLKPEENAKNADNGKSLDRNQNIGLVIINFVGIYIVLIAVNFVNRFVSNEVSIDIPQWGRERLLTGVTRQV